MLADAALPEPVLNALATLEDHLKILPNDGPEEIREMKALIVRLTGLLINFSRRRNLRYPLGDENG